MQKAISALNTMTAAVKIGETDWVLTTAYYARYFALYAFLIKMGVKSEIHDCTVYLAELLAQKRILNSELAKDIAESKRTRVDTQYYVQTPQNPVAIRRNVEAARRFVLEIEKAATELTVEQIDIIRAELMKLR
jgi:uncharacterized protein (UPF0332 family)